MITIKDLEVKGDKTECWATFGGRTYHVEDHITISGSPPEEGWSHFYVNPKENSFIENTKLKKEIRELKMFIEKHFKQMAKEME